MNLYELAQQVKPDNLKEYESKVVWKGSDIFAYMIRIDDTVYLRMSFSQAQLCFYWLDTLAEWVTATLSQYKEIAELWAIEREQLKAHPA